MRIWLRNNARYLPRFAFSGGLVVLLDFGIYSLLYLFGSSMAVANIVGMLAGLLGGFFLHKNFTFSIKKTNSRIMFGRYSVAFLVNLGIASYSLPFFHQLTHEAFFSKIATMFIAFVSNFLASRHFVFTTTKKDAYPE